MTLFNRWSQLFAAAAIAVSLPSAAQAQGTSAGCASATMSQFSDWFALASGASCSTKDAAKAAVSNNAVDLISQASTLFVSGFSAWTTSFYFLGGYGYVPTPYGGTTTCMPFYTPCWNGGNPHGDDNDDGNNEDENNQNSDDTNDDDNNPPPPGDDDNNPPPPGDDNNNPPPPGDDNDNPPPPGDDNNDPPPPDNDLDQLVNQSNSAPEPATLLLVASGLGGVGALARRRKAARKA